jgi:hypothetical protein
VHLQHKPLLGEMLAPQNMAAAMNTSAVAATTSRLPHNLNHEWTHSRSQTEPVIESPERGHKARLSVDGLPRQPMLERDNTNTSNSPSKPPKKKRRSTTLTSIPTRKIYARKDSGIQKSPSVPTFHTKQDSKSALPVPASESLPATPATPLLRVPSNASTTDSRSPSQRRAPASHSSYGVETSNGPPPSFTTQRTLSQDRLWKPSGPEKSSVPQNPNSNMSLEETLTASIKLNEAMKDSESNPNQEDMDSTLTPTQSDDGHDDRQDADMEPDSAMQSRQTFYDGEDDTIRGLDAPSADEGSKNSGSDDRRSEDLFLNIAQTDSASPAVVTRSERRKVSPNLIIQIGNPIC